MRYSYIPTAINWHAPKEDSYKEPINIKDSKEDNGPHPGPTPGDLTSLLEKD